MGGGWSYVCPLVDPHNREIVGHAAGMHKDARLVKSALATLNFPLGNIEVFHTNRGSEFDKTAIDELLDVFGIKRSLPRKISLRQCGERIDQQDLKAEFIYRERFSTPCKLQVKLSDYVRWYNNFRPRSTLSYMGPFEFGLAGRTL